MNKRSDFWSRRRAGVEAEAATAAAEATDIALEEQADRPDAELLAEADLPDPDTLDSPEAVQEFLRSELPQRLKTRALRRLWRLNPMLANLDGLVDYGEDYTDAATVVENMQTVYQVGKGMMTAFAQEEPEAEDDDVDVAVDPEMEEEPTIDEAVLVADAPEPAPMPQDPDPIAQPQRRMRFQFQDA